MKKNETKKAEKKNWLQSYISKDTLTGKITSMMVKGTTVNEITRVAKQNAEKAGTKWCLTESSVKSHLRFLAERNCSIKKDGAKIQVTYAG